MIIGVGTDILLIDRIRRLSFDITDIFMRKTYSQKECGQAIERDDPALYFATRFAGKEAVFKALGLDASKGDFNQIEILNDSAGRPYVTLCGEILELANEKGISGILVSLSYDTDYATAFAIAQAHYSNPTLFQSPI